MSRDTLVGIDPKLLNLEPRDGELHLYHVAEIPLVDCDFWVAAPDRDAVTEVVCDRAIAMDLPLIWREIEAL